jgi:hypothetical protein
LNNANVQRAFSERVTLSEAVRLAGNLLGCYPNGDKPAQSYLGAIAEILQQYPRFIAEDIRAVARECKFLPTVADVVAWCERRYEAARKPLDRQGQAVAMFKGRAEDEALQVARALRPTLAQMQEQYGADWGIKGSTADRIANERKRQAAAKITDEANAAAIAAMDKAYDWNTAAKGYTPILAELLKRSV